MELQPALLLPALSRRRALALMAASLALGGSGCSRPPRERIYPWVEMPEARGGGQPLVYASACVRDGHALGVLVATEGGRPIKIEGNPAHPSSLGATDVFAQASVLELWDPDRSGVVLQGLGAAAQRGAAAQAPASWSAFETTWQGAATRLRARGGEGLRILTGPTSSPTLRAQLAALLQAFPRARWHQHAPLRDAAAEAGALAAFRQPVQSVLHLERARCVVALGADPFSEGPGAVRHAMDWSAARRKDPATAARLVAVETTPGLFGARADTRIALAPARIDALVGRLALALQGGARSTDPFEASLLQALQVSGADSLLVPGAGLAPATQALVHAIHQQLGAQGRTVTAIAPLALAPEAGTLAELLEAMRGGAVDALVVLDCNPAYDAPGFERALRGVRLSVHAGLYADETAQACHWHLPLAHGYEQWSDALAHDGSITLVQPAIAPLYDGRSAHEVLALLAGDDVRDGHALVQRTWRARWGGDFDARWRDTLQRGCVADSAAPPLLLAPVAIPVLPPDPPLAKPAGLTALFVADPSVHDGRYANNGWLQELPRPFTKLTWDNALLLGPATAAAQGLRTGDMVRATSNHGSVDAPVWVLAGQAEDVVTVPLGYGRRAGGRIGSGVGFDGYPLRGTGDASAPLRLEPLGARHSFAVTQHEMAQHGRELARTLPPAGHIEEPVLPSLYAATAGSGPAWAMAVDLDTCIGCNACTVACQAENNIPVVGKEEVARGRAMHWIRVDRYESAEVPGSLFQPVACMHCENAPCEVVCPVGATMHDSEGLNVQVYNRCIGTRFCSNNCPYKVRRFNFLQYSDQTTETLKGQRNPNVTVRSRGVMEKCTYCVQRITRARQHAQASGDAAAATEVVTACQSACPTRAISFGDLRDAGSAVARLRLSPRHYALLGELNTKPRTTYLARIRPKEAT